MENHSAQSWNTGRERRKPRPGFYHRPIFGLSVTVLVFGVLSLGLGAYILAAALTEKCRFRDYDYGYRRPYNDYRYDDYGYRITTTTTTTTSTTMRTYVAHCDFYSTYISPGLWSGAIYIASGIVGIIASKTKTTCMIVSLMVMSLVTAATASLSATASIAGNFDWLGQFNTYPISLHVATSIVGLFSVIAFILSLIKFGYSCRAVCCNGNGGLPRIKKSHQYQPLHSQPLAFPPVLQATTQAGAAAPEIQPPVQQTNTVQPVYLVQGHQVIGMLPSTMPVNAIGANVMAPFPQVSATQQPAFPPQA